MYVFTRFLKPKTAHQPDPYFTFELLSLLVAYAHKFFRLK
jgi:hypothetical protein